jgi:hypothetical protein
VHASRTPAVEPYRDAELRQQLAVTADTDRGESPFGWSDIPPAPHITRGVIDAALFWDGLRRRAAAGSLHALTEFAHRRKP